MQMKESEIDLLRRQLATSDATVGQLRAEVNDLQERAERESSKWQKAYDSLADAHASTEQELLSAKGELMSAKGELNDARQSEARRIEEEEAKAIARQNMRSRRTWHLNRAELDSKLTRIKDRIAIAS